MIQICLGEMSRSRSFLHNTSASGHFSKTTFTGFKLNICKRRINVTNLNLITLYLYLYNKINNKNKKDSKKRPNGQSIKVIEG